MTNNFFGIFFSRFFIVSRVLHTPSPKRRGLIFSLKRSVNPIWSCLIWRISFQEKVADDSSCTKIPIPKSKIAVSKLFILLIFLFVDIARVSGSSHGTHRHFCTFLLWLCSSSEFLPTRRIIFHSYLRVSLQDRRCLVLFLYYTLFHPMVLCRLDRPYAANVPSR